MPHHDPKDDAIYSRRNVVKASVGLLVTPAIFAASRGASAQTEPVRTPPPDARDMPRPAPLENPLKKFPRPPFPAQEQPFPGLTSKMNPRPDHGEKSYRGSNRLLGRKALITGGDSGIGRAAAIAFAREGADVVINYLPAEESDAQEVVELLRAEGRKITTLPGDITSEEFCTKLVSEAVAALGGLDILVNNAGKQHAVAAIADLTSAQFDATLKTNAYALFWITKAAIPHMPAGSSIINVASIQAFDPSSFLLDYAPTKAFIANFTQALAKQLAGSGIRVNAIAPGPFWTPLQPSGGQLPGKVQTFGEEAPFGRPGQPAEIASAFVTLAAADSSFTTGQIWGITGGKPLP